MQLEAREPVIFAEDFSALVVWYQTVLGFDIKQLVEADYHYCLLENKAGIRLGIADAQEMGVHPGERRHNTVVLQFEVKDVAQLFAHLSEKGGSITFGPSFDKKDGFWFGGFYDLEGNPFWVVDENCPG
jgi:predicted enzyme related to lactoylglutathione lyase